MQIHRWDSVEREVMSPRIARQVVHSARMTTARIHIAKGGVVPRHSHDNEQISHVLQGRLLFEFDGRSVEAAAGEIVEIAPNEPHSVTALEDSLAMDVFAPVRADWLSGDDAYLRNPPDGQ